MAKFTAQGGLKLHFNGDRGSFAFDSRDPFHFRVGRLRFLDNPVQIHRNKVRTPGCGRVLSGGKKSNSSSAAADEHLNDDYDENEEDYYEKDELSCFRGLVLDISYRYCSSRDNLTVDHVLPMSRGGEWTWENLVTACAKCNSKKGKKTLEEANMKLIKVPKVSRLSITHSHLAVALCQEIRTSLSSLIRNKLRNIHFLQVPKDYDILAIPLTTAAIKLLRMRKGVPDEWQQYLSKPSSEP